MSRYKKIKSIQENVEQVEDQITGKLCIQKSVDQNAPYLLLHQFHVEVDILSTLHHPQIPEIMNVYSETNRLILVESFIPGKDFSYYLTHSSLLFRLHRTRYMLELIDIMQQIHEIGYLYIDLKPSNLLLYKNHVHLIDFNACIPMHSSQAVFASKENVSAELYSREQKNESTDVYSFGKLLQHVYPHSLYFFIKKCTKADNGQRYQSWKTMKKAFLVHIWLRRIFLSFLIILSVFFIEVRFFTTEVTPLNNYRQEPNITTFFNAYQDTLSQFSGTTQEKIQMNLYQWLEKDWIPKNLWKDNYIAKYLLLQSIQSKNPILCHKVLDQIENTETMERYVLLANHIMNPEKKILKEQVDAYLTDMEKGDIQLLMPILLNAKYILDPAQMEKVNTSLIQEKEAYECVDACTILEYNLFLKSQNQSCFINMQDFEKRFGKERSWEELYELFGRSK